MNVVFLDYDGVVNTLMWNEFGTDYKYNFPDDHKVNNFQNVQWLSSFCKTFHCSIVVTSTWRKYNNYKECLINGGLWKDIEIIGKTDDCPGHSRFYEISKYLEEHEDIKDFIILDDDDLIEECRYCKDDNIKYLGKILMNFIHCNHTVGFSIDEYEKATRIAQKYF